MRRAGWLGVLALAAGCATKPSPPKAAYYGPTDDLATVVDRLNARTARFAGLRAEGTLSADVVDPDTGKHDSPPRSDVTLLLTPRRTCGSWPKSSSTACWTSARTTNGTG